MSLPRFEVQDVADDNDVILLGVTEAVTTLGYKIVAYFLDQVPERGFDLWERFNAFQDEHPSLGFVEFISHTLDKCDNLKSLYPKGCEHDRETRELLSGAVLKRLSMAGIPVTSRLDIYFGINLAYDVARATVCLGCLKGCPHRM